ncbi:MAG: type II toxin-antitoxin system VapC family toxin [Saprospiraceae bacterium]|nr:type II toxin-antitoxin system VapC family toxin [Saprospiraceae bacterium]
MNRYLLDTHALIWFMEGERNLSTTAQGIISDARNEILVSIASFWEMAIKISLGKLKLTMSLHEYFQKTEQSGFLLLQAKPAHVLLIETMPWHHKDPFDRMLIAQGLVEDIPIVSKEILFDSYGVKRVW